MLIHLVRPLLGLGWVLAVSLAWAQGGGASALPQDVAPRSAPQQASVPLSFQSVMKDYRPYNEQPVGSWMEANRTVGQIGGWRAYAREASQPDAESAPAPVTHHGAKP